MGAEREQWFSLHSSAHVQHAKTFLKAILRVRAGLLRQLHHIVALSSLDLVTITTSQTT